MRSRPDGRDTRNARGRATVRAIEREALRLAVEQGAAAVTVDRICEGVGISQRAFFHHFDTKDDALLGWDLPRVDEHRVREYLADPAVGILTGAMTLVDLPREVLEDPATMMTRICVVSENPALAARHLARLRPVAQEVAEVVLLKLRSVAPAEADEATLRSDADTITAIAAALTLRPTVTSEGPQAPDPRGGAGVVADLRWVWDRLL